MIGLSFLSITSSFLVLDRGNITPSIKFFVNLYMFLGRKKNILKI